MAIRNFSPNLSVVNINGNSITDWGQAEEPFRFDYVNDLAVGYLGQSSNSAVSHRESPGVAVTLSLMPGGPDSTYLHGLLISRAVIALGYHQIGTLETATGLDGFFRSLGPTGRAGTSLTDDVYVIQFNRWAETRGGEV